MVSFRRRGATVKVWRNYEVFTITSRFPTDPPHTSIRAPIYSPYRRDPGEDPTALGLEVHGDTPFTRFNIES